VNRGEPIAVRTLIACLLLAALLVGCGGAGPGIAEYASGNYPNARRYLTPLAQKGDPEAQYYLGQMSAHSLGGPRDPAMAEHWYRASAEQGYADSQYQLGLLLAGGQGVAKDENAALAWLRKAADQGHPQAEFEWQELRAELAERAKSEARGTVDPGCPYTRFYPDEWEQGGTGDSLTLSRRVLDTFAGALEASPFVRADDVENAYWRISVLVSRSVRDRGVVHGLVNMRAFADFEGKAVAYGYESRGEDPQGQDLELRTIEPPEGLPPEMFE